MSNDVFHRTSRTTGIFVIRSINPYGYKTCSHSRHNLKIKRKSPENGSLVLAKVDCCRENFLSFHFSIDSAQKLLKQMKNISWQKWILGEYFTRGGGVPDILLHNCFSYFFSTKRSRRAQKTAVFFAKCQYFFAKCPATDESATLPRSRWINLCAVLYINTMH